MNPYYPDARTKRHFERMESDPEYRERMIRRHRRRIAAYHRAMDRAVRRWRQIIEQKRAERNAALLADQRDRWWVVGFFRGG